MMRRHVALFALLWAWPLLVVAQAPAPLAMPRYLRVELPVPAGFQASCVNLPLVARCNADRPLSGLNPLLAALRTRSLGDVRLSPDRRQLELSLPDGVSLQGAVLPGPPRWVLEVGEPRFLLGAVEDETPFVPYPVPWVSQGLILPPSTVEPLAGADPLGSRLEQCHKAWRSGRLEDAQRVCELLVGASSEGEAVVRARLVFAEVLAQRFLERRGAVEEAVRALERAEREAPNPVQAARYALLTAQVHRKAGRPERAEALLEERVRTWRGTTAEPYLLAAFADQLAELGETSLAKRALDRLGTLRAEGPAVGVGVAALAADAYGAGRFLQAMTFFDTLKARWPELITRAPEPLFEMAEVLHLFGRVREAGAYYREFLERFPRSSLAGIVRVRLAELDSARAPERSAQTLARLAAEEYGEAQMMAFVRLARVSRAQVDRQRILTNLKESSVPDHTMIELLVELIRDALARGELEQSFSYARQLWTMFPDAAVLERAPLLFQRIMSLLVHALADSDQREALAVFYFQHRKRLEAHVRRGDVHLTVGKALRGLALTDEALKALELGLGGRTEELEPETAARLYLEMAGVFREAGDAFRLARILDYLDARHPGRFDEPEYWLAKASRARAEGRLDEARSILVYALNGAVTLTQRISLACDIAELNVVRGERPAAIKAFEACAEFHDEAGLRSALLRRDAVWRVAELAVDGEDWLTAVPALKRFVDEYPRDPARAEATFLWGRGLLALGDLDGAARHFDEVSRRAPKSVFGKLAQAELGLLNWQRKQAPKLLERLGL